MFKSKSRALLKFFIIFLVALFSIQSPAPVSALDGFSLGPGVFTGENKLDQTLIYPRVNIKVDTEGNLSAKTRETITEKTNGSDKIRVITIDISIMGNFDPATGAFTGDFTFSNEYDRQSTDKTSKFHQVGEDNYTGTLSGLAVGGDKNITLIFKGKNDHAITHYTTQNGKEGGLSQVTWEQIDTVAFPVQGNIPDPEKSPDEKSRLEDSGAAFSDLAGQVEVNYPQPDGTYDEEDWHFAKLNQGETFPVGTHIKTSSNSHAIISFADMTTFTMGPESEIILSSPTAKDSQFNLLAGTLWANVKKMMKDGSMEVEMSQAVAGIKGTTFVLEDTKDASTIKVIEGSVAFKSKTGGQSDMVNAGEKLLADKKGLGQKTAFDVNSEQARWEAISKETTNSVPDLNIIIYAVLGMLTVIVIVIALKFRKKKAIKK